MKLNLSLNSIGKYLLNRIRMVAGVLIGIYIIIMGYFCYNNIYRIVISPAPINKDEIIAKKQKVNLDLFNTISNKVRSKKSVTDQQISEIKNPL